MVKEKKNKQPLPAAADDESAGSSDTLEDANRYHDCDYIPHMTIEKLDQGVRTVNNNIGHYFPKDIVPENILWTGGTGRKRLAFAECPLGKRLLICVVGRLMGHNFASPYREDTTLAKRVWVRFHTLRDSDHEGLKAVVERKSDPQTTHERRSFFAGTFSSAWVNGQSTAVPYAHVFEGVHAVGDPTNPRVEAHTLRPNDVVFLEFQVERSHRDAAGAYQSTNLAHWTVAFELYRITRLYHADATDPIEANSADERDAVEME